MNVVVPESLQRAEIHRIIFEELCKGKIKESSKSWFLKMINGLHEQGVQAIILGCTEIGLLIEQSDIDIQLFDTTELHSMAAVDFMVS